MIISRTPFRVSFFGGGTDYPAWYREHNGSVISTTINRFSFISLRYLPKFFEFDYKIRYFENEMVNSVEEIRHPSVRECLKFMGIEEGVEMIHNADLPAQSGLGSSSTFTVGMLHAAYALRNEMPTKRELAENSIKVEQEWIGEYVGSQDQTAAAFGGFNRINFGGPQHIHVIPIIIEPGRLEELEGSLLMFFTGLTRNATEIAEEQINNTPMKKPNLFKMMELVEEAEAILKSKTIPLEEFGRLLHQQWMIKREMSSQISNSTINDIYETGLKAGALGGKLLGAGGGGMMLFYVPPESQAKVVVALNHLLHIPFRFDYLGSQIIYYSHQN